MGSGWWSLRAYEKTTSLDPVELSYSSVVRFGGHVHLKGVQSRTVEAYVAGIRLLARWAGRDPGELGSRAVREFFLHLLRARQYAPNVSRLHMCARLETAGIVPRDGLHVVIGLDAASYTRNSTVNGGLNRTFESAQLQHRQSDESSHPLDL